MNFEDTVGQAIIDVLAKSGIIIQNPDEVRDQIGVTAIRTVSEWLLKYSARPPAIKERH